LIDVGEVGKDNAGMLAKFYTSNKNFVTNKPYDPAFYERSIEMLKTPGCLKKNNIGIHFGMNHSAKQRKVFIRMIDTFEHSGSKNLY
jgi:hypothetical protein